ncbi:MAG: serine protease [Desulfobaccales bacterium]
MWSRLAVSYRLLFILLTLMAGLPQSALALTASQVYEQVKDSVVVVKAYDQQGKPVGLGSGVMLPSGDVITNYHVVKSGVRYMVGQGKKGMPATLKAGDPQKDLCLLKATGLTAKPARLGQAVKLKVGEPVYAVGAPQGLELSLSEGIVSQLRGDPPPIIQTTVAISKGSSGGGLFNAEGELVGITTFYLKDSQSLNFALPVEWIGQVAMGKILERPIPTFQPTKESLDPLGIGRHWLIEWKSQYYYQGTLEIQEELEKNRYLTRITIRYSNEKIFKEPYPLMVC